MMNSYPSIDSTWEYAPVAARPTQEDSTIFVWLRGTGDSTTIYAQKVDNASGLPQWLPYDGVPVCTVLGHKRNPVAVYDTMGGVIIGWEDYRHRIGAPLDADSTSCEIYAQRLFTHDGGQDANWNPAGQLSIGTPVCSGTNAPARDLRMVGTPDGAYFTWTDYRNSSGYPNFTNKDVYVQNLLSVTAAAPTGGSWVKNGIRATRQAQDEQQRPDICLDFVRDSRTTRYGVYVAYESDSSSTYHIKANNVRSGGTFNAAFDLGNVDINLTSSGNAVTHPRVASTGTYTLGSAPYGAFACWEQMDSDLDIIGEGFDEQAAPFWGTVAVCTASEIQAFPCVAAYSDQAVIAWEDHRNSTAGSYALDVYANVIDLTSGNPEATPSTALTMSAEAYEQKAPDVDFGFGQDEMYVCWEDHRDSLSTGADIYAQGIECLYPTQLRWGTGGRRVSAYRGDQVLPHIAGEVVVWQDGRRSGIMGDGREDTDIYCELFGDECDDVTGMHWRDVYAKHTRGNAAEHPRMAVDSAGNRFMIWDEERGSSGGKAVWIQKFDRWGVPRWANNGIMLSDDQAYAVEADVCTDGAGGAYAVWLEDNSDVKLTRVYSNGSVLQTVDVSSTGAEPKVVEDRTLTTISGCFVGHIESAGNVQVTSYSPALQYIDYANLTGSGAHNLALSTTYENGVWAAISDGGNPDFKVGFWDPANGSPKIFQPIAQIESSEFDIVTDRFPYTNSSYKDPNTQLYDLLVVAVALNDNDKLQVCRVGVNSAGTVANLEPSGPLNLADGTSYTNWDGACSPSIAIDSISVCGDEGPEVGGALVAWANRYIMICRERMR
ncbi:MAG: hypothetical protein RRA94_03985 [Bacteroidota bacterium]|nr:hypothetical protein [Bacteroidota bacterium]